MAGSTPTPVAAPWSLSTKLTVGVVGVLTVVLLVALYIPR
jgi:hypothetical protein